MVQFQVLNDLGWAQKQEWTCIHNRSTQVNSDMLATNNIISVPN